MIHNNSIDQMAFPCWKRERGRRERKEWTRGATLAFLQSQMSDASVRWRNPFIRLQLWRTFSCNVRILKKIGKISSTFFMLFWLYVHLFYTSLGLLARIKYSYLLLEWDWGRRACTSLIIVCDIDTKKSKERKTTKNQIWK